MKVSIANQSNENGMDMLYSVLLEKEYGIEGSVNSQNMYNEINSYLMDLRLSRDKTNDLIDLIMLLKNVDNREALKEQIYGHIEKIGFVADNDYFTYHVDINKLSPIISSILKGVIPLSKIPICYVKRCVNHDTIRALLRQILPKCFSAVYDFDENCYIIYISYKDFIRIYNLQNRNMFDTDFMTYVTDPKNNMKSDTFSPDKLLSIIKEFNVINGYRQIAEFEKQYTELLEKHKVYQ